LDFLDYRAFNLHASFLPFNRGAHPVLWSILENTPFGISIHRIDEGLDTGPIFIQKRLEIVNDQQSIRTIYDYANQELVKLFCTTWAILRSGQYSLLEQKGCGTYHKSVQSKPFMELLDKSWDSSVTEARLLYSNYLKSKSE
jgi:methionyl-tRNA formyltransferase